MKNLTIGLTSNINNNELTIFFDKLNLINSQSINADSEFYEKKITNEDNYFDSKLEKDLNYIKSKEEVSFLY
jgi:hypothetical protein